MLLLQSIEFDFMRCLAQGSAFFLKSKTGFFIVIPLVIYHRV